MVHGECTQTATLLVTTPEKDCPARSNPLSTPTNASLGTFGGSLSTSVPSAIVAAVQKSYTSTASCLCEAQRRATDFLASSLFTAANYIAHPFITMLSAARAIPMDIRGLVDAGSPEVTLLGVSYRLDKEASERAFREDFCSRPFFTYRHGFSSIPRGGVALSLMSRRLLNPEIRTDGVPANECPLNPIVPCEQQSADCISTVDTLLPSVRSEPSLCTRAWDLPPLERPLQSMDAVIPPPGSSRPSSPMYSAPVIFPSRHGERRRRSLPQDIPSRHDDFKDQSVFETDLFLERAGKAPQHSTYGKGRSKRHQPALPLVRQLLCTDLRTPGGIVSDVGWGCIIRASQMAVSQSLIVLRLGRDWRLRRSRRASDSKSGSHAERSTRSSPQRLHVSRGPEDPASPASPAASGSRSLPRHPSSPTRDGTLGEFPRASQKHHHDARRKSPGKASSAETRVLRKEWREVTTLARIMNLFADDPEAPLSIHSLAVCGKVKLGIPIGRWFGPTSCAQAIAHLMTTPHLAEQHFPDLATVVFPEGLIVRSLVSQILAPEGRPRGRAALIIVCMRLGSSILNVTRYRRPISECFRMPQFQGMIGGGSETSALYFCGTCAHGLIYLDPHSAVKDAVRLLRLGDACPDKQSLSPELSAASWEGGGSKAALSRRPRRTGTRPSPPVGKGRGGRTEKRMGGSEHISVPPERQTSPLTHPSKERGTAGHVTATTASTAASGSMPTDDEEISEDAASSSEDGAAAGVTDETSLFETFFMSPGSLPCVLPWRSLGPSVAMYFLCETPSDFDDLLGCLREAATDTPELFEVMDQPLSFEHSIQSLDQLTEIDDGSQ